MLKCGVLGKKYFLDMFMLLHLINFLTTLACNNYYLHFCIFFNLVGVVISFFSFIPCLSLCLLLCFMFFYFSL